MCVCVCALITEGGDTAAIKTFNKKNAVNWSTADNVTSRHNNDDNEVDEYNGYRAAVSEQLRERDKATGVTLSVGEPSVLYRRGATSRQCVCLSVCECDVCRHYSINTSLYPMIGSCTTSSCHVGSVPRPQYRDAGSIHHCSTDCSTCCVYEYALDSFQAGLDSLVDTTPSTVDCSAMKGASLSWSTVHSAPAVLGRLTRYKLPVPHRSVYNCTTVHQGHERRERHGTHIRDRRDELRCYHSPFYYTNAARYQPLAADNDGCYDKIPPSLCVAKPVLSETQFWV